MTRLVPPEAFDEALSWAARIQDPQFEDWDGHAAWLEADPSHSALYQRVALAMEDGLHALHSTPCLDDAVNGNSDAEPLRRRRWSGWTVAAGGALAASIAGLFTFPHGGRIVDQVIIRTAPGETRDVRLPDGTVVALNGASAIRYVRSDPRRITLDDGEAFFAVVHDARNPLELTIDSQRFRDVGTEFDAVKENGTVRLSVAEGAVSVDPEGSKLLLTQGQSIKIKESRALVSQVSSSSVGSWRTGRLIYEDTPLSQIAADVERAWGQPVRAAASIRDRRFSGVLTLPWRDGDALRRFAKTLRLDVTHGPDGWLIVRGPDAAPG